MSDYCVLQKFLVSRKFSLFSLFVSHPHCIVAVLHMLMILEKNFSSEKLKF